MKKIEIKTEKATLLVVDLPLATTKITEVSSFPNNGVYFNFIDKDGSYESGLKSGMIKTDYKVKHLGKVSEITEEEWKGIVDSFELFNNINVGYKNYYQDEPVMDNATESGLSLLKANGILLQSKNTPLLSSSWMEAQQKVWYNPHVFIKRKNIA